MQNVIPALRVASYARSRTFYVEGLGFTAEWEHRFAPNFPVFASLRRDDMTVFLTEHAGDCVPGGLVHFYVPDVDAWHAEYLGRGVAVQEPPSDDVPGVRIMTVVDPDGNKLRFCTRRPERA